MDNWRALTAAEQEVSRRRAEIYQSPSRIELITRALSSSSAWDKSTALTFLQLIPEDVPELLDLLVGLSLSPGWAQSAREAIRAARREIDPSQLFEIVERHLSDGDAETYAMLAEMLTHAEEWETLGVLIQRAIESNDPEIEEVAREFNRSYGGMLP